MDSSWFLVPTGLEVAGLMAKSSRDGSRLRFAQLGYLHCPLPTPSVERLTVCRLQKKTCSMFED